MISRQKSSAGFTLIEAVMVMTITGIIAAMVSVFITKPVIGYVDSVKRAELTDAADVALRRIARDVHLALPNSLRTIPNGFEFIMTKSGGRYRAEGDGSTGGNVLSFAPGGPLTFDMLGAMPSMDGGDRIVVYNLGPGYSPADAYAGGNVATIAGAGVVTANPVTLISNPFTLQNPPLPSPDARLQVVDKDDLVVRYVCSGGALRRYAGCSLATPSVCSGTGALLAGGSPHSALCSIDYASTQLGRNGLLYLELTITDSTNTEAVTLFQQIHVDNSP